MAQLNEATSRKYLPVQTDEEEEKTYLSNDEKDTLEEYTLDFANSDLLLSALPHNDKLQAQFAKLRKRYADLTKEGEELSHTGFRLRADQRLNGVYAKSPEDALKMKAQTESDIAALDERIDKLDDSLTDFSNDYDDFVQRLLKSAEYTRSREETYSKWAWWASATLFALGWGLGLVGKLYGVPEAAPE